MASSQIELASSHFGCVLRDHNWRNRERESNGRSQVAFQKNLKELVTDHLHTCIVLSAPIDSISSSDENSQNRIRIDNRDCWVDDRNDHNFQSVSTGEETQVESSAMNGRQSQILDRWASRQARERITTTERQTHEAELLALSNSQPVSARASTFLRESPRAPSDISVDLPNLQASSLVQRWREFETEARLTNSVNSSPKVSSARMNSTLRNTENASSYVEDTSPRSEVCDPADYSDERYEALAVQEDTFADWESDQTTPSEQLSSSQGLVSSDVGERERVRVADIIRRLTSASGNHQIQSSGTSSRVETDREQPTMIEQSSSSSQDHIVSDQGEFRGFLNGRNRLRLRGRQAFVDVLMQMERERQRELTALVERRAVSRFSHRGRIQSMLRLRFLQREVTAQGQNCPAASKLDRLQQGTTILQLRERYSPRVEQDTRVILGGEDNSGSSHTQLPNNTINLEHSDMSSQLMNEDDHHQEVTRIEQDSTPSVHLSMQSTGDDLQEEAGQSSDITFQGTSLDLSNLNQQGSVNAAIIPHEWEASVVTEEPDPNAQQVVGSTDGTWLDDVSRPQRDWGGSRQAWYQDMLENLNQQEPVNAAITPHDWEGNAVTEETNPNAQQVVGSTDGTLPDDVSRPQRDWGGSRQAWYQDVLENSSENGEIRELLERRSVSTSLASGFRETMDQLILSYLHRHQTERAEEEVEDNLIEHPYPEVSDGSGQIASPSLQLPLQSQLRTQSWHRDHDVNDDSNQIASTALLPSQSYYQDSQQWSPFTDRSSREMELICDLGGHMVQLHNEMSELRKLIEGCMDMQMKLQHSIKQEVSAAVYHSVRGEEVMELFNREPMRKGSCCICYEMQVDSLLYRCGHMCTCFKCAHELQWSSGRCPICGAPILDIVRAYSDS